MNTISKLGLRRFTKLLTFSTLFLIFAGALVKSFEAGLSVPDWPTTYGMQMFSFPMSDMVGGIFYEHGHRMIATFVGALTVILVIWVGISEQRVQLNKLALFALVLVLIQGLLGGLTVLYYLPTIISLLHGVTAQTFLLVTILIAFIYSKENSNHSVGNVSSVKYLNALFIATYVQLIVGAWMRHSNSGLAIGDFPLMNDGLFPSFTSNMLSEINYWRFDNGLESITLFQVFIHFLHRITGYIVFIFAILLGKTFYHSSSEHSNKIKMNVWLILTMITVQIVLGGFVIWSFKGPFITSFHVLNGAVILSLTFLLYLRTANLKFIKELQLAKT